MTSEQLHIKTMMPAHLSREALKACAVHDIASGAVKCFLVKVNHLVSHGTAEAMKRPDTLPRYTDRGAPSDFLKGPPNKFRAHDSEPDFACWR